MDDKKEKKLKKGSKKDSEIEQDKKSDAEDQKDMFGEIKKLILRFYIKADTEQIESLEKVMQSGKKIAEGRREFENIEFPELKSEKKIELVLKSIEVDLDQDNFSNMDENLIEFNKSKKKKETFEEKKRHHDDPAIEKLEIDDKAVVPEIIKKIRKMPLISKSKTDGAIFGEPLNKQPKMNFSIMFIVDEITFALWGDCRSCMNSGEKCKKCNKRGGVRAKMTGFTFVPKPIEFTVWGSQLFELFGVENKILVDLIKSHENHARKSFLKLYRARLFISQSQYTEYKGQLKISANNLNCLNWNSLLVADQE